MPGLWLDRMEQVVEVLLVLFMAGWRLAGCMYFRR